MEVVAFDDEKQVVIQRADKMELDTGVRSGITVDISSLHCVTPLLTALCSLSLMMPVTWCCVRQDHAVFQDSQRPVVDRKVLSGYGPAQKLKIMFADDQNVVRVSYQIRATSA